jgi:micrococcal nuclease
MKTMLRLAVLLLFFATFEIGARYFSQNRFIAMVNQAHIQTQQVLPLDAKKFIVTHIVDGDTIEGHFESSPNMPQIVRFLGIDTPEIAHSKSGTFQYGGITAQAITTHFIESSNNIVFLSSDKTDKDDYNRLLRHIFLKDGTYVNAAIVCAGYAQQYIRDVLIQHLRSNIEKCETQAKENQLGIWNSIAKEW